MAESSPAPEQDQITIHQLLERSAWSAINIQREDGSFPPGRNGVYDEKETPVRTTSHWLTTLSSVFEFTGNEAFADAANDAADYLLSDEARPYGYTFHSRTVKNKDRCDGLVGQSTPIRGLATAGKILGRKELIEVALDVIELHPFDEDLGLWERVDIDGSVLSIDRTLNHQILFAGAAAQLALENGEVKNEVSRFTTNLDSNMCIYDDGIIKHYISPPIGQAVQSVIRKPRNWRLLTGILLSRIYSYSANRKSREIAYHPVNLLGLSQLKSSLKSMNSWSDIDTDLPLAEIIEPRTLSLVDEYDGEHGAMTPGIDIAIALQVLCDVNANQVSYWLEKDIQEKFDTSLGFLSVGTKDPVFQAATISYIVDLPDCEIQLNYQ